MRQKTEEVSFGSGIASQPIISLSNALYPYRPAFVVIYSPNEENEASPAVLLTAEVHELCHTNQDWHIIENLQPDKINNGTTSAVKKWMTTQAGQSFTDLVGFTQNAEGKWELPENSLYRNIYSIDPTELSAELCAMYFLNKMNEPSTHTFTHPDLNVNDYLTPEVVEWIETYIVLPN